MKIRNRKMFLFFIRKEKLLKMMWQPRDDVNQLGLNNSAERTSAKFLAARVD